MNIICGFRSAELSKIGEKATAKFEPVPAGEYKLYTLQRLPVDLKFIHEDDAYLTLGSSSRVKGCRTINNSADIYKDIMGPDGGRGVWRWDSPLGSKYSSPYQPFVVFKTGATDSVSLEYIGKEGPLEVSHILIVPENGADFDNDIVKYLFGRNHRPWAIAAM